MGVKIMKNQFIQKMFWQLMGPSILAAIGLAIANIADSLVVGISTGSVGLATIGLTVPIYMIYAVFYVGLGIGGSVEFARLAGEGKVQEARKIFNMTMFVSVGIGLIFCVAGIFFTRQVLWLLGTSPADGRLYQLAYQYAHILLVSAPVFFINTPLCIFIRNDDAPKLAGIGFAVGNVIDVVMNFTLVLGLKVGVAGSIWATVIGQTVSVLILSIHILGKKEHIMRIAPVMPECRKITKILKSGMATSNQYVLQFIFIMIINHILNNRQGNTGVAVFDVVLNVSYVGLLFFYAAGDALQPLVSTFHGERNIEAQEKTYRLSLFYGLLLGGILLLAIMIGAETVCGVFGLEGDEEIRLGAAAVRIYCVGGIFAGANMICSAYYQSVEDLKKAYFISFLRGMALLLLFTVICSYFPDRWFFSLFPLTEICCLLLFLLTRRLARLQNGEVLPKEDRIYSMLLGKNEQNLAEIIEKIESFCESFGATAKQNYYVTVTAEEICSAILENAATGEDDSLYISLTIIAEFNGDFRLCIRDNALAFNPFDLEARKAQKEDDEKQLGGLGIFIVKQKAKNFYYRRYLNFNTLNILV